MTDNNTQSTTQADRQQTTTDRESGRSGDASSSDGLESPARRDVLKAIGSGALIGVLGTGSASADPASFGNGVNLQPSYFCDGDQALGWDLMNDHPDIETVRIEIEPFSFDEVATTVEDAKRWIDEAAANGKNVIATYHHYPDNGSAEASALQDAADFWVEHYETLAADTDFTVNLMNEWGNHDVTAEEYASAYNDAISTVRSGTSYDGPIVCDAPGWGQGTYRLADAVESIDHDDLILSAHVYPSAWNATTGQNLVPEDLDVLDETGYPCMIGEFGNYADSTGADWSAIIDYAKALGWPVIGWAWNGDGSDDPMNMANPYWGDDCGAESYTASEYFDVVYDKLGDSAGGGDGTDDGDDGTDDGDDGTDDGGDTGEGSDGQDDGDGGTTVDLLAEIRPSTTDAGVGERFGFGVVVQFCLGQQFAGRRRVVDDEAVAGGDEQAVIEQSAPLDGVQSVAHVRPGDGAIARFGRVEDGRQRRREALVLADGVERRVHIRLWRRRYKNLFTPLNVARETNAVDSADVLGVDAESFQRRDVVVLVGRLDDGGRRRFGSPAVVRVGQCVEGLFAEVLDVATHLAEDLRGLGVGLPDEEAR